MLFDLGWEAEESVLTGDTGSPSETASTLVGVEGLLDALRGISKERDRFEAEASPLMPEDFDLDWSAREKVDGYVQYNVEPPPTRVDDVVVTGRPWRVADYNPGWYDWDGYDTSQPENPYWYDPRPYDACEDRQADTLASQINSEIAAQPDSDRREYGALIWRDDNGNLHRTALRPGTNGRVDWPADPTELGLDSYSRVVGMVHSHPSWVNLGTDAAPNWVQASHGWMHGGDWAAADGWMNLHNLSFENFTMYISYQGQIREYDYRDNVWASRTAQTDAGSVQSGDYNPGQACP